MEKVIYNLNNEIKNKNDICYELIDNKIEKIDKRLDSFCFKKDIDYKYFINNVTIHKNQSVIINYNKQEKQIFF